MPSLLIVVVLSPCTDMWGAVINTGYNGMTTSLCIVRTLIHCLGQGSMADKPSTSRCPSVSVADITDCVTSPAFFTGSLMRNTEACSSNVFFLLEKDILTKIIRLYFTLKVLILNILLKMSTGSLNPWQCCLHWQTGGGPGWGGGQARSPSGYDLQLRKRIYFRWKKQ